VRSPRTTPAKRAGHEGARIDRTLGTVVGPERYAAWVDMLATLVPGGRTHRLAVVVAGMLQQATYIAVKSSRGKPQRGSVAESLLRATGEPDPDEVGSYIGDLVTRLFRDARVSPGRVSADGDEYTILDGALQEFAAWDNMPWE
jgi:hypothetical protein